MSLTSCETFSEELTSTANVEWELPQRVLVSARPSELMSLRASFAPSEASFWDVARLQLPSIHALDMDLLMLLAYPIPDAAPVTRTTLPLWSKRDLIVRSGRFEALIMW